MKEEASSQEKSEYSFFGDEIENMESDKNKNNINFSKNSSNLECILDTVNKKIKYVIENGKDLSYSNSNSKISDHFQNKEQFLYSRYWRTKKKSNNDTDSSSAIMENKINNLNEEEKILYYNINFNNDDNNNSEEEENNIDNMIDNKFNDDFDEEDMEEKTIEKRENDMNEINSIKVNNNNLNNKDSLSLLNNFNSNNELKLIKSNNNINTNLNNNININLNTSEKINSINTPNKLSPIQTQNNNNSFIPYIYNTNQVHSFISSYNNYPSNLSKGSFISTNNSSNNKYKKNEDHSEIEEDEIKINNSNTILFTHANKFGPHLIDYSHIQNTNINLEQSNLNSINNINNFNMNNNFLYNRIPKMNLNMVYYIPIQQQTIPSNNNYMNNAKIIPNLNNGINTNENNNNININLQSNNKESSIEPNNNINNKSGNGNNVINITNNNASKIKEKEKEKEKEKSNSKEKKNKNKNGNNNLNQKLENNNSNNNIINSRNNNNNSNNTNYKNNNINYKINDTHNTNINNNSTPNNNTTNNLQGNKCEKNLLNLDDIVSGKDTRTTVMIRNIPIKYTDNILINALEEFKGKYDCLYMPYDYEKKGNKGYAFINFVNPLHILYFHEKFCGKKWPLFESSKICELNSANFQGIYEIQKHSKNYKGFKKPLFYSEPNKNNINGKENVIIPLKYLNKLKIRFPKMKYKENKSKKIFTVETFE